MEATEQRHIRSYKGLYGKGAFWWSISGGILRSSRSKYLNSVDPREYGTVVCGTVSETLPLCNIFHFKLSLNNLIKRSILNSQWVGTKLGQGIWLRGDSSLHLTPDKLQFCAIMCCTALRYFKTITARASKYPKSVRVHFFQLLLTLH